MLRFHWAIVLAWIVIGSVNARADDAYFRVRASDLTLDVGRLPEPPFSRVLWSTSERARWLVTRVELTGEGEAFFTIRHEDWLDPFDSRDRISGDPAALVLAIRAPAGRDVAGQLFLPKSDLSGMVNVSFTIRANRAKPEFRKDFLEAKALHYEGLAREGIPGGAWFRFQARQARAALAGRRLSPNAGSATNAASQSTEGLEATFDLFSGGRALSESLQLDRGFAVAQHGAASVDINSLDGITVRPIDWGGYLKPGANPTLDALAAAIPADQHAVFFPSFAKMVEVADRLDQQGTRLAAIANPHSEDLLVKQRYERQLCLSTSDLARLLGPQLVRSVALTGSDPYFPTGTDVAVLLEPVQPASLLALISARAALGAAADPHAQPVAGEIGGVAYHGFRSPDRSVSVYVALVGQVVVVTNALQQLARLVEVEQKKTPAIAALDEFKFFRTRYPHGDKEEAALVFLSDATIRRWCGPKWRIANSRRTRDLGVMQDLQAEWLDRLVAGTVTARPIHTDLASHDAGELHISAAGVNSTVEGTLAFQTPILELPLHSVTPQEADAYIRWRDGYERNWRWAFDPIAIRIHIGEQQLAADLTVMPLIFGSQYRTLSEITRGAKLESMAGDPHGAPLQLALAINPELESGPAGAGGMARMISGVSDPLSWLGSSVAVWIEDDPFWKELADQPNQRAREQFLNANWPRVPVAVQIEVSNPVKLTAFLIGVRAYLEQVAPGMIQSERITYREQPYVKVTLTARGRQMIGDSVKEPAVCYAITPAGLVLTLRERLLKESIDRQLDHGTTQTDGKFSKAVPPLHRWLGQSVCLQLDHKALSFPYDFGGRSYQQQLQELAWSNLPILNEWKRRYSDRDPVALHEQFWQARLVCPGGGKYVWNDEWQTMESTVFGHPGQPKLPAQDASPLAALSHVNFGLTFEQQGLRARVEVEEKPAEKTSGDTTK